MSNQLFKSKAEKDITADDGKIITKGTKLVKGVKCPECGTFYAKCFDLYICNKCRYRKKRLKPHQLKKYKKDLIRKKIEKEKVNE